MKVEVKRGYRKWTDENGVFHKELIGKPVDLDAEVQAAKDAEVEEFTEFYERDDNND